MQHYVKGKVVVITGGSSGFGLEAARMLLEMGCRVVITGRSTGRLAAAVKDLGACGDVLAVKADACRTADWKKLVQKVVKTYKRIDVLVLNHGAGVQIRPTEKMTDAGIAEVLDINIASAIKGSREVLSVMRRQKSGHIITVSSACAYHSWAAWGAYTAAKAGLVAFTRCLHVEMSEWGGKATSFIPGAARTGFCNAAGLESDWLKGYPDAKDFARTLVHCIDVPPSCFVEEVNIWGTAQVPSAVNPF